MKSIPVSDTVATMYLGSAPAMRDGIPIIIDGVPMTTVSVLAVPPGHKPDTIEVRVPTSAVPLTQLMPYTPCRLPGLVARPWSMSGRSGVSYSATAAEPVAQPAATTAKASS
jgi:hypothetical protein